LDVTCRPVVHENHTEEVIGRILNLDHVAHVRVGADETSKLELEVKLAAGSQDRLLDICTLQDLTIRTLNGCTADHDARRSAMISDRQMHVVRLQGVLRSSEQSAYVVSMVQAGVEISVIADLHGQMVLALIQLDESFLA
jgi:hypothetical protein